jgi:serine/threonine protein kinase
MNNRQNNQNAQQLNITTILSNNSHNNERIVLINNIFNNNNNTTINEPTNPNGTNDPNSLNVLGGQNVQNGQNGQINVTKNKYEIKKYLGEGIQGSLYMAFDVNNNKYICKQINLNTTINPNQLKQLQFELNLLKYLSSHKVTREYINPCLEYKIIDNQVFTLFPVFNGYSLYNIKKYLLQMNHSNYYKILFHLIKAILHGLAKIHQHNIAHQNINENSILVSTYTNNNEMKIKFTDFGLGCGVNNNYMSNIIYDINSCNSNTPLKITNSIIKNSSKNSSKNNSLYIAQKNDIILLCTIFIQLLLFFENIKLDLSQGYNDSIKEQLKNIIIEKFLSQIEKYRNSKNPKNDEFMTFVNINNEVKKDILEYLNIFNNFILCESNKIKSCQYILDKLIIYEKYKNDKF